MTRISLALALLLVAAGAAADKCDDLAPEDAAACTDHSRPKPPMRWPIPAAVPRPVIADWSATVPGFNAVRELVRFAAPGWQGAQVARLYLHGRPTLPGEPVSCTVRLERLDGAVLCEVQTTDEAPSALHACPIGVRVAQPIQVRVMLTAVSGGTCHYGGGWWAAPNP